eukprot:CAMPEP_0172475530 /NCGR_PEP_ID=MMETSP1065-20121228/69917_1 /TAXON_ID=265537 /ORGANISM="Amphiprora paludosa, Strain CCMP125" /LENGTH=669 /DNA_ID=CAMNT_0013233737 /DNA_START=28 /DNA_END=2038 /DNA_ORIENTATION=-
MNNNSNHSTTSHSGNPPSSSLHRNPRLLDPAPASFGASVATQRKGTPATPTTSHNMHNSNSHSRIMTSDRVIASNRSPFFGGRSPFVNSNSSTASVGSGRSADGTHTVLSAVLQKTSQASHPIISIPPQPGSGRSADGTHTVLSAVLQKTSQASHPYHQYPTTTTTTPTMHHHAQPLQGRHQLQRKAAAGALSPVFARFCGLAFGVVLGLAGSLSLLATHHQAHSTAALQAAQVRVANRQLHDYMLEHGVDEPLYMASAVERYLLQHADALGFNTTGHELAYGCRIWTHPAEAGLSPTNDEKDLYRAMSRYRQDLERYQQAVQQFRYTKTGQGDIRLALTENEEDDYETCQQLELPIPQSNHDDDEKVKAQTDGPKEQPEQPPMTMIRDLQTNYFSSPLSLSSQQHSTTRSTSQTTHSSSTLLSKTMKAGWMEPLVTPMRHPDFCFVKKGNYLNLHYLIHDFAALCRRLKPHSKIALFDISGINAKFATELKLVRLFTKFGIKVDHIHAFEIASDANTPKSWKGGKNSTKTKAKSIESMRSLAPRQLAAAADLNVAYHFVAGDASTILNPQHPQNPFRILQQDYTEHDFVLVKIDIDDTALELALVQDQLLSTPALWPLVDQLYFEHHVHMQEMTPGAWKESNMGGSILDSLQLFAHLRQVGIAAHFWV